MTVKPIILYETNFHRRANSRPYFNAAIRYLLKMGLFSRVSYSTDWTCLRVAWMQSRSCRNYCVVANRCCVTFTEIRTLPLFVAQTARKIKISYYIAYFTAILYGAPWRGPRMGASDMRLQLEWRSCVKDRRIKTGIYKEGEKCPWKVQKVWHCHIN